MAVPPRRRFTDKDLRKYKNEDKYDLVADKNRFFMRTNNSPSVNRAQRQAQQEQLKTLGAKQAALDRGERIEPYSDKERLQNKLGDMLAQRRYTLRNMNRVGLGDDLTEAQRKELKTLDSQIESLQSQIGAAREAETQKDIAQTESQSALERVKEEGRQQRKTAKTEADFRRELLDEYGLVPSGFKDSSKSSSTSSEGGLESKELWDAWTDFSERYDMQHQGDDNFGTPEYRIQKFNSFNEVIGSLGIGARGQSGGGEGGTLRDRLLALAKENQGEGAGEEGASEEKSEIQGEKTTGKQKTGKGKQQQQKTTAEEETGNETLLERVRKGSPFKREQPKEIASQGEARRDVGFFSGGLEGIRHRADVLQQGVNRMIDTARSVPEVPQYIGQRLGEEPALRNEAKTFADTIAQSYMDSLGGQTGGQQINPNEVPNLTAEIVKKAVGGSQEAYNYLADAVSKITGDTGNALATTQEIMRELTDRARQQGVDLSNASSDQIMELFNNLFGGQGEQGMSGQQQRPFLSRSNLDRTRNMNPRQRGFWVNYGVPSLKAFDAE